MTATQDSTVAARIPIDLRADLERLAELKPLEVVNGKPTMTPHLRRAIREYVDRELGNGPAGGAGLFAPANGAVRRHDGATSKRAASQVAPRTGTQRRLALEAIAAAGKRGMTTDEVVVALDGLAAPNSTPRRVTDLLESGAIEPVPHPVAEHAAAGIPFTRLTRYGSQATVWVATEKGRAWLKA